MSVPAPKVPLLFKPLVWLLTILPGLILWLLTISFFVGFINVLLNDQQLLFQFMMLGLLLAYVWYLFMRMPAIIRGVVMKLLGRGGGKNEKHH